MVSNYVIESGMEARDVSHVLHDDEYPLSERIGKPPAVVRFMSI